VHPRSVERDRASPSLHEQLDAAVERCADAHETSRQLIEETARVSDALHETLTSVRKRRRAARPERSETDR
jgi:hypothetical protein